MKSDFPLLRSQSVTPLALFPIMANQTLDVTHPTDCFVLMPLRLRTLQKLMAMLTVPDAHDMLDAGPKTWPAIRDVISIAS